MTLLSLEYIEELRLKHQRAPHERIMQKALADAVTTFIHGPRATEIAQQITHILFNDSVKTTEEWAGMMDEEMLHTLSLELPTTVWPSSTFLDIADLTSLLTAANIFTSKREAREVILAGGVQINGKIVADPQMPTNTPTWQANKYLLVQKGKKKHYLILVQ